jgi:hypothetical protein
MNTTTRIELRAEIELIREKFHRFLVTVPDSVLRLPSKDLGWTNGEILYLMSVSPRVIKPVLKRYMHENPPQSYISRIITGPLLQKTSELFIRSRGQNSTRWSIAMEYDHTCAVVLELLDAIPDEDFDKTLTIPELDSLLPRQVTIAELFRYVKCHFYTYRKQVNLGSPLSEKRYESSSQ